MIPRDDNEDMKCPWFSFLALAAPSSSFLGFFFGPATTLELELRYKKIINKKTYRIKDIKKYIVVYTLSFRIILDDAVSVFEEVGCAGAVVSADDDRVDDCDGKVDDDDAGVDDDDAGVVADDAGVDDG